MLRHYGTSHEGVLGKIRDFYFGKTPIHLTEEYYKNYLYILYVYAKIFTSDVAEQFSKLVIESIDTLYKELPNGDEVYWEFKNAKIESLADVKKTWLYKNILTKSNKTYLDIQNKLLSLYKSLGIEFKGLDQNRAGVWFPYIPRNLNNTDNSRSKESTLLVSEVGGWYTDLNMHFTYGKNLVKDCLYYEDDVYEATYPFPILYNNSITLCDPKGKCSEEVSVNTDKFDPGVMYSYIKANLNNLGKFKKAYDRIKLDDVKTLGLNGFDYHRDRILRSSNEPGNGGKFGFASKSVTYPFYLDHYNSCLGGFVDCPISKSFGANWKSNIEESLRYIEYKYLK